MSTSTYAFSKVNEYLSEKSDIGDDKKDLKVLREKILKGMEKKKEEEAGNLWKTKARELSKIHFGRNGKKEEEEKKKAGDLWETKAKKASSKR